MFKKLISNLPFNPSLLDQVAFYAHRIKQEESLRRLGFGFVALAMFIQIFAVAAPPQKSLAYSSDYIINGLKTRDDILRAWDGQTSDANVAAIYGRFGLTRADVAALPYSPNVTLNSCTADYWTIGRTSLSAVSKAGQIKQEYKNSEVPVDYGGGAVYLRQLKAWDIVNSCNTYKAFQGTKNGQAFWILVDCGNFTQVGAPPLNKPALELRKTVDGGPRTLKPGDTYTFNFEYRNPVAESIPATDVMLEDDLALQYFDVISFKNYVSGGYDIAPFLWPGGHGRSYLSLPLGSVGYTPNFRLAASITVKLKAGLPNGTRVCNAAKLRSLQNNVAEAWGGGESTCINVLVPSPCKWDRNLPADSPNCKEPDVCPNIAGNQATVPAGMVKDSKGNCVTPPKPCKWDSSIFSDNAACKEPIVVCTVTSTAINKATKEATLTTKAESSDIKMSNVTSFMYDFGDGTTKTNKALGMTDTTTHAYKDGKYTATVTVNYTTGNKDVPGNSKNATCAANVDNDQPLGMVKSAKNISQNLTSDQTVTTKANAGDIIEYSLIVKNTVNYDRVNVNVTDEIGDILDYADLDMAFLQSQGGSFDAKTNTISWPAFTAPANKDSSKLFRVTVKNPVPSTNQPSEISGSFNCVISNNFGTQVDIPINCPIQKDAEYVTTTLPNTGPGASLIIGFSATVFIAYFFARSRLLAKELDIIRSDYATGGGF